jgi:hypothetical protein
LKTSSNLVVDLKGPEDPGALEELLLFIVQKFGPISTEKIFHLVQCFYSFGIIGPTFPVSYFVSQELNNLMLGKKQLAYSAKTGLWHEVLDSTFNEFRPTNEYPRLRIKEFSVKNLVYPTYGFGREFVYVIYETETRIDAIMRDRPYWLLKVGRTNNIERRVSEISQSGPNSLVIGSVFKTDESKMLEKFIHNKLGEDARNHKIPGRKEWFYANLTEIHSLWLQFKQKVQ